MARVDTLSNFLTDVADAIRAKKGTSDTIAADTFDTQILSIPTGGGTTPITRKDVNFYDYDGALTNSYTKAEFLELTELPSNPSHTGLTAQGWNWSLSDAKTYLNSYDSLSIGQNYITDDSSTRIYIHLEEGRLEPYVGFAIDGTATIDWGDNTTSTVVGSSTSALKNTQHTYSSAGDYIISISSESTIYILGNIYGSTLLHKNEADSYYNKVYQNAIRKVELGDVAMGNAAFQFCYSLQSISIPSGATSIGTSAFQECSALKSITIPSGVTNINMIAFQECYSLQSVSMPSGVTSIGNNVFTSCYALLDISIPGEVASIGNSAFSSCYSLLNLAIPSGVTTLNSTTFSGCRSLLNVVIPNSVTSLSNNVFYNCLALSSITLPSGITAMGNATFSSCYSLSHIIIPGGVTNINANLFNGCYGVKYYDFSNHTSVPTMSNVNAFNGISSDCKIIVPDDLYESWIAANRWSTYASHIIKVSDL